MPHSKTPPTLSPIPLPILGWIFKMLVFIGCVSCLLFWQCIAPKWQCSFQWDPHLHPKLLPWAADSYIHLDVSYRRLNDWKQDSWHFPWTYFSQSSLSGRSGRNSFQGFAGSHRPLHCWIPHAERVAQHKVGTGICQLKKLLYHS